MSLFLTRLRSRTRKLLGLKKQPHASNNLTARFTYVYRSRSWRSSRSASGPGSDRSSGSVLQALKALSEVTKTYEIRSISDVPCGDFNWMPEFLEAHPDIDYYGYDIVSELISKNRHTYPEWDFEVLDLTRKAPPQADLIFSKDLLNHLTERDVWRALANLVLSGSTYVMATSNGVPIPNVDLSKNVGGASRVLNLQTPPYSFPPPLYDDGYLAMWRTTDLVFVLERRG